MAACAAELGVDHPMAVNAVADCLCAAGPLSGPAVQAVVIAPVVAILDYAGDWAVAWRPDGRAAGIRVDLRIGFGMNPERLLPGQDQLHRLGFKFPIIMMGHRIFPSIEP
ncbi:hypothetical protein TPY_2128 [Sulfobacillus acidophilus TPY]|uniref:Uncharacterized protein n=1 Tax=Sulfobacillus acidophilus (strain ATCC 700253 / DSM 10332 / NAL) TaxID=679936 RepID=G8TZC6_SULAD|nr:hypothetical protein TPY_2128 [Sulfobacillus acidophilus TPY]AEW04095.1 hypothetical protein Sulac_0560 [Sulfobacillus acidophilus DSM 10332]